MKENSENYEFCIKLALNNAKKRIKLLSNSDKKCLIEEYKEWIKDGVSNHTVLLLRDDPIIWKLENDINYFFSFEVTLYKK